MSKRRLNLLPEVLDILPATVNAKAQQNSILLLKTKSGVDVVVDDTLNQIRQIVSFLIIGFHFMKMLMWHTLCLPRTS
jgi:hypothetical protein